MKIFSNFDTRFKADTIKKFVNENGQDNVLVIQRSALFAWLHIYIPFFFYTLFFVGALYFVQFVQNLHLFAYTLYAVVVVTYIMIIYPIFKHYLDYYFDFSIITPQGVHLYNQRWLFARTMSVLNVNNIRTVNVQKVTLIYSLFDNGDIIFLSEWAENDLWDAKVYYVKNPEDVKYRIEALFSKGRQTAHTQQ